MPDLLQDDVKLCHLVFLCPKREPGLCSFLGLDPVIHPLIKSAVDKPLTTVVEAIAPQGIPCVSRGLDKGVPISLESQVTLQWKTQRIPSLFIMTSSFK